jgi:hypothetical protein
MSPRFKPLVPRNGGTLQVLAVQRISGCGKQKEVSKEDQLEHAREEIAERYQGPVEFTAISTTAKGERLDRPELVEIERLLRTRTFDVFIVEDIGRLIRGSEANRLCGIAVDCGTRVLSPNDGIDSNDTDWESAVIGACQDHVSYNEHTSRRIKHKLNTRFKREGLATNRPMFGYMKPLGAKYYDDWQKDEAATPILKQMIEVLKEVHTLVGVADWLNAKGVKVGPSVLKNTRWTDRLVRSVLTNTLLKGMARRGTTKRIKHHGTGRRISVPNEDGPVYKEFPHLAHLTEAEFDDLQALIASLGRWKKAKPTPGQQLWIGTKRPSRFPANHATCGYCGSPYVWGACGAAKKLMCDGARQYRCWNSTGLSAAIAADIVTRSLTEAYTSLDGFDEQLRGLVKDAARREQVDLPARWADLERDEATLAKEEVNLQAGLAEWGPDPLIKEALAKVRTRRMELRTRRFDLERHRESAPALPGSAAELRQLFVEKFRDLTASDIGFATLLRRLIPEFTMTLVRMVDNGRLYPRANLVFDLSGVTPDAARAQDYAALLRRPVTVDLFVPPLRERIRVAAVHLREQGMALKKIPPHLPETASWTVVRQALEVNRLMRELGLTSPYLLVTEMPADSFYRRWKHPRYRFEPRPGYPKLSA